MPGTWKSITGLSSVLALVVVVTSCGGGAPETEPAPEPRQPRAESPDPTPDPEAERRRAEEEAARRRAAERERVLSIIRERVHFDFDKSDIRSDAEQVLQRKVTVFREYPGLRVRVEGHCDERGSDEYNLALGQRRAEAVRRYLVSYGLDPSRFATISYGEEKPLVDQQNESAWAQNRRAEFVVLDHGQLGQSG